MSLRLSDIALSRRTYGTLKGCVCFSRIMIPFVVLKCLGGRSHRDLIRHGEDRPGHDFRYAIESQKTQFEFGWEPGHSLEDALRTVVDDRAVRY